MSRRRAVTPAPVARAQSETWSYSSGKKGRTVYGFERAERRNEVTARWTDPATKRRRKRELGLRVRNDAGALDAELVIKAQNAIDALAAKLLLGQSLEDVQPSSVTTEVAPVKPLSLRAGFDKALDPVRGAYPSSASRRYQQMVYYRDRLFGVPGRYDQLINPLMTWDEFDADEATALGRRIADAHLASGRTQFGPRVAEQIIDAVYTVASYLRQLGPKKGGIEATVALPREKWRKTLKSEWATRTGTPQKKPRRPRHTPEEYRCIIGALWDPRVDPRIHCLIDLAAELRSGQALACNRTHLRLPGDPHLSDPLPKDSLGECDVPGNEYKPGETVYLTEEQRRTVDHYLSTFLSRYEEAWRAGHIQDYPLFPIARVRTGDDAVVKPRKVRTDMKRLTRDGARQLFRELEDIAGVEHVKGRGWYGLRRIAADLTREATKDDRVVERMGGWTAGSDVPKEVYEDRETIELRQRRAAALRVIRGNAPAESASAAEPPSTATSWQAELEAVLASMPESVRAAVRATLEASRPGTLGTTE